MIVSNLVRSTVLRYYVSSPVEVGARFSARGRGRTRRNTYAASKSNEAAGLTFRRGSSRSGSSCTGCWKARLNLTTELHCCDALGFLDDCHSLGRRFDCVFADPPDNIGLKYDGCDDNNPNYLAWLDEIVDGALCVSDVAWFSVNPRHLVDVVETLRYNRAQSIRLFIWSYNFGQYNETDAPYNYRPIFRVASDDWSPRMVERIESIREQMRDKRATGRGRVPGDVWEFPRIQGNNKQRRPWHPTQHPEAVYRRIMMQSVPPGGTFCDLFAGTGTAFRAAKTMYCDINVVGVEKSAYYCSLIADEHGIEVQT